MHGGGGDMGNLLPSTQFFYKFKTVLKNKVKKNPIKCMDGVVVTSNTT